MAARIEKVVTSGTFSLDGGTWDVDNNVWLIGDDHEVLVIDAAHDATAILEAVGERRVVAVVCTHGHNDHINAAVEVAAAKDARIALHPADTMLWQEEYDDLRPGHRPGGRKRLRRRGHQRRRTAHPGHSPGGVSIYAPDLGAVFSGDTLFHGGPGATGRSHSDFPRSSTRSGATCCPCRAAPSCTPGTARTPPSAPKRHLAEWIARGH